MTRLPVILVAVPALAGACSDRDDLDGTRRPIPGLTERGDEHSLLPDDSRVALDLLDNRAAAVVHGRGGLTIECGTADFAKYVEGSYRSHWFLSAEDSGRRVALIDGLAGALYLPLDSDPGGVERAADGSVRIYLTARAAKARQLVSVFVNEKRLGDISMPTTEWQTYSIRAPAGVLVEGENKLRFYFRYTGEIDGKKTAAAIQRIRVGPAGAADEPALRADTVTRDHKRLMALRVGQASRLSYYLRIPDGSPALVFAPAGQETALSVRVTRAGGQAGEVVWSGSALASWTTTRVDLSPFAGQVVRLDLSSEGPADWGRPQIVIPERAPPAADKKPARMADHVIVWVVSALRADSADDGTATPGFASARQRGIDFASAYTASSAPGAAHVAMLTGKHPQGGTIAAGADTLGKRFSDAGFATALISGNGFVNDDAGFAQGFATYRNPMRRRHPFRARVLWQQARRILYKHREGKSFIYLVTVEPHLPYDPTPESLAAEWDRGPMRFTPVDTLTLQQSVLAGKEQPSREEQAYIRALYHGEVRDADAAFAEMLADLDELGIADRTAVILVGDHGEELFERNRFGHGEHLYQEVIRVPLVVLLPRQSGGEVIDSDVSLIDLPATALELAGLPTSTDYQGTSLLAARAQPLPRPIFAHLPGAGRSLKLGRYKLHVPLRGDPRLHDLEVDPGERDNLMGRRPIVERYMRNVFGVGVAYQSVWSRSRWGAANDMSPAFAADHGL